MYNKHTGEIIGFTDLGNIKNHLLLLERMINEEEVIAKPLVKSILEIMMKGLFTSLKFRYAHFLCINILVICFLIPDERLFIAWKEWDLK